MRLGESREDKEFSKGHIVPSIESAFIVRGREFTSRRAVMVNYDNLSRLNGVVNLKRNLFFLCSATIYT